MAKPYQAEPYPGQPYPAGPYPPGDPAYGGPGGAPQAPPPQLDPRSIGDLFRELAGETSTLLRQEVALAKTEIKEEVRTTGKNVALIGAGGALAYAGLIVLLIGLGRALGRLLGEEIIWLGPLLLGAIVVGIGAAIALKGLNAMKAANLTPERTLETLKEDKQWLQNEKRELTS